MRALNIEHIFFRIIGFLEFSPLIKSISGGEKLDIKKLISFPIFLILFTHKFSPQDMRYICDMKVMHSCGYSFFTISQIHYTAQRGRVGRSFIKKNDVIFPKNSFYLKIRVTVCCVVECIGQSRGEVAMRLLLELNHEVRGDCVQQSVEQVRTHLCNHFLINQLDMFPLPLSGGISIEY